MPGPAEKLRFRNGPCRRAIRAIPEIAAGELGEVDPEARAHVEQCLRCQAEVVAYRRLLRTLRAMRGDVVVPPRGSVAALLAALDEAAQRGNATGWAVRAAYVGGLTAAAGAAGVLVWVSRRRPGYAQAG